MTERLKQTAYGCVVINQHPDLSRCLNLHPCLWVLSSWGLFTISASFTALGRMQPELMSHLEVSSFRRNMSNLSLEIWDAWSAAEILGRLSCLTGLSSKDVGHRVCVLKPFLKIGVKASSKAKTGAGESLTVTEH